MKLIDVIEKWSKEEKMSLYAVEKMSGLPRTTLYNLKYGKKQNSLNLTNATKIAIALNKDMNEFKKLIQEDKEDN
ncbi:helix-turn-helix domain-containing protein [Weissella minor]|uniref:helix-turn-helix domain-containing protein n=1 Tax=Weissella minor TaxID=1620 RepID=UPI001BAF4959|nr:helix-turn-helix domain-containing protein [Weissella minor]MBS0950539.1 helix-turn-helix domain-containing protein [Weissella minor]